MRSKFAKRHYESVATTMQSLAQVWSGNNQTEEVIEDVIRTLAYSLFKPDNAAFDVDRFRRACVPGANVRART